MSYITADEILANAVSTTTQENPEPEELVVEEELRASEDWTFLANMIVGAEVEVKEFFSGILSKNGGRIVYENNGICPHCGIVLDQTVCSEHGKIPVVEEE